MDRIRAIQRGLWIEDPFCGEPPDGNKSGSHSWVEISAGGGVSDQDSAIQPAGAIGAALLQLPARAIPVAPDGAGIRLRTWGAPVIISANDMVGQVCSVLRIFNSNIPKAGSDYYVHFGVMEVLANQVESTDGFYLFKDDAIGANWILKHRRAGATTLLDTGFDAVDGAWQTLAVEANVETGRVTAFGATDGDELERLVAITPADIQPATAITSMAAAANTGNVTLATDISLDYIGFGNDYGVFR